MMSTTSGQSQASEVRKVILYFLFSWLMVKKPPVTFESNMALRTYVLNRPKKLNALDETMLGLLRPQIEVIQSSSGN